MTKDKVLKALRQAYNLGQIYWQQADSEYISQHKKADQTEVKFQELLETTVAALEAKDEPVAWDGYNLDDMCEAFNRVIEEHFHRKHPFHDPVNNDAMIALRTLRGFIPYMKRHTTPSQRKPLTDEEIEKLFLGATGGSYLDAAIAFARAIEAAHGIKGENT